MSDLGNKNIMAKNIQRLMEQAGKSRTQVCDDLGIKYTTFTDWVNAKTYPRIDKIEMMANYFGVSKSDLVESRSPSQEEDERQKELEQLANEIRKKTQLMKNIADSTYNFYLSLGDLAGLSTPIPQDIIFRPQQAETIGETIRSLVKKFLSTATSEERADFWSQYSKIGNELNERLAYPEETPYPSPEEIEMYSTLTWNLAAEHTPSAAMEGPQTAPAPQEDKDTTPAADGPETPPEGE